MLAPRNNYTPKYVQIYDWLRGMIDRGRIQVDEKLPTEIELTKQFQATRMTVRKAVDRLELEGMIERKRGQGTFLKATTTKKPIEYDLADTYCFFQEMEKIGIQATVDVLELEVVEAPPEISTILNLGRDKRAIYTYNRFRADGEPVMLEKHYMAYQEFKAILDMDLTQSRYPYLVNDFKVTMHHAHTTFSAVTSSQAETALLGLTQPLACILLEWVLYDANNIPIETSNSLCHGEKHQYKAHAGNFVFNF